MVRQDYQPLLDKLLARFNSWTARHLSFAGRLQLIHSVIYSTITFWASVFILPNSCIEEIESMCSAFLWKGTPNSARGAKVNWESVCTPKESGGLRVKRLNNWNKVFALKLIWLIFAAGGSLWVSWVRLHLIGNQCFWDLDGSASSSWIWRNLCKLRPLAKQFIICEVGSVVNLDPEVQDDFYLWKIGDAAPSNSFSTADTWRHLHPPGIKVDWFDSVWFKGRIPKHAIIAWLNSRHRLLTRDRLVRWGFAVPSTCLLCSSMDETRQLLFFDCSYTKEVWHHFTGKVHLSPPSTFEAGVRWLKNPCRDKNITWILRLLYQASVYSIWKERNSRIHSSIFRPASALIQEIKNIIRAHLGPLTLKQRLSNPGDSLLVTWFRFFL
ncbi:PREDICTED: uncharacterized protein LOC109132872 [Camelina sativa]|uniref:Uncharacterized protein LOC109132872 n=1 Tax=Camelina sativa TaxID=90675 RepID=A0ABM1RPC5_CAMSA|nr:PREDICTED: uncharacterized protein LOC109132872 [Camelina sativa]